MDNYRRPASPKKDARHDVEGFLPAKTNTADQLMQPPSYRVAPTVESRPVQPRPVAPVATVRPRPAAPIAAAQPRRPKLPPIDMDLPDGDSFGHHYAAPRIRRQVRRARTMMLRTAFAGMALLIGVGGLLLSQGFLNLHRVFKGTAQQAAALNENVDVNQLKGEGDGRVNVLLTGIGGEKHAGGDLTDTLMLASIDPVNHTAALLSVPRDLWVTIPGKGSMKINAAYALAKYSYMKKNHASATDGKAIQAGFTSIDQTIEKVLGVPVHYNVLVNFQAFRQAIDTVGGITVDVPEDLYDPTMAWENKHDPYLARAGVQQFDGRHALMYARSRETSSDFARSERQRAVLLALKQKTVNLGIVANPAKLSSLISAFGTNVHTDLSLGDASRLYTIMKKIKNDNIQSVSLAGTTSTTSGAAGTDSLVTTGNINGQSVVMPKAGLENYDDIQDYVRSKLQDGYILKEKAKVLVVNGTVQTGLASSWAKKLKGYGYNVVGTATTETRVFPTTQVIDVSHKNKKYTRHYLEQRFSTTAVKRLPDPSIKVGTADFVIILGSDSTL